MVLVVAQPVDDYLHESGGCPVIDREKRQESVKSNLFVSAFLRHHYSMYNGLPQGIFTWVWMPSSHQWTFKRPVHQLPPSPLQTTQDLSTDVSPASLTGNPWLGRRLLNPTRPSAWFIPLSLTIEARIPPS